MKKHLSSLCRLTEADRSARRDEAARRDAYEHIDNEEVYNIVHMDLRHSSLSVFSLVYVSQKQKCCNFAGGLLSYVKTSVCLPTPPKKINK